MENGKYAEPNSITLTQSRFRLDENLYSKNAVFVTCTRLLIYLSLGCYNSMDSSSAERVKTID